MASDAGRGDLMVSAAYALLEEAGLEGLTIRAVLARTGLSRRAFYERFGGKDDLVLAVFGQAIRTAARTFGERAGSIADPLERLRFIVVSIVLAGGDPDDRDGAAQARRRAAALSREHVRLAEARPDELQAALRPLIALIAAELAAGITAGTIRAHAPERAATLVYNLVSTTVHSEFLARGGTRPDPVRRRELAEDIWEFCRRAIAA